MPFGHPSYPCVDSSLKKTRGHVTRGNTFGQIDAYHETTSVDREKASRFDVQEKLRIAIEKRKLAQSS